jgi:hypothetical protein
MASMSRHWNSGTQTRSRVLGLRIGLPNQRLKPDETVTRFITWLAVYAGIWVGEGVLIVLFASIQAGEILFNQKRERPEGS